MKRKVIRVVSLLLVLILLLTGCVTPKKINTLFPHYEELSALIGKTMDEALQKMGWQEEDVPEVALTFYSLPIEGEISGVPVQMQWGVDLYSEKLDGIIYTAGYPDDPDATIRDTWKVISAISDTVGKKPIYDGIGIDGITEDEFREIFENRRFDGGDIYWDISSAEGKTQKDYRKALKKMDFWEEFYRDKEPVYAIKMKVSRSKDTVFLWIHVGVCVEPPQNRQ